MKRYILTNETKPLSPLLRGACMEDVNHELYGGIWSQMIFGEAFAEPKRSDIATESLSVYGNSWKIAGDTILCKREGDGPKAVFEETCVGERARLSVVIEMTENGIAGLLARVNDARAGEDAFFGYEIAVGCGFARLAKHENNFTPLVDAPCSTFYGEQILLGATLDGGHITVSVNGSPVIDYTDDNPLPAGRLGIRAWNTPTIFRDITLDGADVVLPEVPDTPAVSGMWLPYDPNGTARYTLTNDGYHAQQAQMLTNGGIYNRGLNRSGMFFAKECAYRGFFYAKSADGATVTVSLANADCTMRYASTAFSVTGDWTKYAFTLTAGDTDTYDGSFLVEAEREAVLGYVFLEPDEWGLYKGLHVRRDVGEALEQMGISMLRFGGCMANARAYRWKDMIGPIETRRPYHGWWYPYSSFGFGILEFMELCEALGVECVPDFNGYETEADLRDFARYAFGTDASDPYVRMRLVSSHPAPFRINYIQFGNEEKVDDAFADRFIAACRGVWSVKRDITMVVGDFTYENHPFDDPFAIPPDCTASHIPTLAPHKRILAFAMAEGQNGRVYFDIHWWSERGVNPLPYPRVAKCFYDHLHSMVPGTETKLCVYELNANTHDFARAMANAYSILAAVNLSDAVRAMASANCLQVQDHNDNGWNQGLLFMNNHSVWYQAAGVLNQLFGDVWTDRRYVTNADAVSDNDFTAAALAGDASVALLFLNRAETEETVDVRLPDAFVGKTLTAVRRALVYPKAAVNTAEHPNTIALSDAVEELFTGTVTLPANSITTYRISL